jgi:hypothetical protein
MFSNLQIFVVGVPILMILGSSPEASFFVRTVVIWMNDSVVITLTFGNLMYRVHFRKDEGEDKNDIGVAFSTKGALSNFLPRALPRANMIRGRPSLTRLPSSNAAAFLVLVRIVRPDTHQNCLTYLKKIQRTWIPPRPGLFMNRMRVMD